MAWDTESVIGTSLTEETARYAAQKKLASRLSELKLRPQDFHVFEPTAEKYDGEIVVVIGFVYWKA